MSQKCYGLVGHVVDLLCKADSGPRLPHFEMSLEMTKCFPDEHTGDLEKSGVIASKPGDFCEFFFY